MSIQQAARAQSQMMILGTQAAIKDLPKPKSGWIRMVRMALNMRGVQLAKLLNTSKSNVSNLEKRERDGSITLNSLEHAAAAMDCQVFYCIVPNGSMVDKIEKQALKKATADYERMATHMALEKQAWPESKIQESIAKAKQHYIDEMPTHLWDE